MYAALIVETRQKNNIKSIIHDHLSKLDGFELIVYHGKDNAGLFTRLDCKKRLVSVKSLIDYNLLLTSVSFWTGLLEYERVLVFQHDTGILKDNISDFLEWDYIGAPWQFQDRGGNGGLSLRSPKAMLNTIMRTVYYPSLGNEDLYFCNHMNGNLAPREECKKFSVESEFVLDTFGYHLGEDSKRYLTDIEIDKIKNGKVRG